MIVNSTSLAEHYAGLTNEKLLRLASKSGELTPDAMAILQLELGRRKLGDDDVSAYSIEQARIDAEYERWTGSLTTINGSGRTFIGRKKRRVFQEPQNPFTGSYDEYEEFNTTMWFVVFLIPVVPLGSYRIKRARRSFWASVTKSDYEFLVTERLPFDWRQITFPLLISPFGWIAIAILINVFSWVCLNGCS